MPKGTIHTAADRTVGKYHTALQKKSKDLPAKRDKALSAASKKVDFFPVHVRNKDGKYERILRYETEVKK